MKYLFGNILLMFIISNFYAQNTLTANISFQNKIEEDKDLIVTLRINKPINLQSYTVFSQTIPEGFFVNTENIKNADVKVQNNLLTIKWLRLPFGKTIQVSYKLSHIKELTGNFSLTSTLTYVINNKKGTYKIKDYPFTIKQTNKTETENLNDFSYNYEIFQITNPLRKIKQQKDNSYLVEIRITNLQSNNNYILTEEIPSGFRIKNTDSSTGKIQFNNSLIQFNIKNPSENKDITIKYFLIPETNTKKTVPVIFGKLCFINKNQIINIPIEK